jgi:carboxyl-terminal processing protease
LHHLFISFVLDVRNRLRGEAGTAVEVSFERVGVDGIQSVELARQLVKIHDVKAATMVGDARDGVGYIELRGFSEDAGREMRAAITSLQRRSEIASNGEHGLQVW